MGKSCSSEHYAPCHSSSSTITQSHTISTAREWSPQMSKPSNCRESKHRMMPSDAIWRRGYLLPHESRMHMARRHRAWIPPSKWWLILGLIAVCPKSPVASIFSCGSLWNECRCPQQSRMSSVLLREDQHIRGGQVGPGKSSHASWTPQRARKQAISKGKWHSEMR